MPVGHACMVQGMQVLTPGFRMKFFTQFTNFLSLFFKLKLGVDYNGDIRLQHTKEGLCGRSDLA
jgi:hypothetical protein